LNSRTRDDQDTLAQLKVCSAHDLVERASSQGLVQDAKEALDDLASELELADDDSKVM
jgi:hypothetical protein